MTFIRLGAPALSIDRFRLGAEVATVRQLTMRRFKIGKVDEVSLAPDRPLHCNQIRERADRSLDTIYASGFGTCQEIGEGKPGRCLREKIELPMRS